MAPKAPDDRNEAPGRAVQTQGDWRETARRLWLWPLAILFSIPIGGFIADLVINGVDSVGTALAGGLIAGAVIGAAGWFVLRQWVSWLWIPATAAGMALGLAVGAALVDYGIDRGDLLLMGAVTGLGVGVLQALVLMRHGVAGAFWWALANPPAWALGWLVTSYVITANVEGAVRGLRRERSARIRTADLVAPRSAVPGDGSQGRGKAGRSRSVTKRQGQGRPLATRPDAVRQGGHLVALSR